MTVKGRFIEAAGGMSIRDVPVTDGNEVATEVAVLCGMSEDGKQHVRIFKFDDVQPMLSEGVIQSVPVYVEARNEWRKMP